MIDILKITSTIPVKNKVPNTPSKLPTDAVFDIKNPNIIFKDTPEAKDTKPEIDRRSLLKYLNKEIFEPLLRSTGEQAESVRKLVLMARSFETTPGILHNSFLEKIFVKPNELLNELLARDKGSTIFRGEIFDSLRVLAKLEGYPNLKEVIVSLLKHFDCYVHRENSLNAIVKQGHSLADKLTKNEGAQVREQIGLLEGIIKQEKTSQSEIKEFIMSELITTLGAIAKKYVGNDKIHNQIMAIVHYIVRYDRADPRLLEEAVLLLGENLRQISDLTDEDIIEMRKLLFENAVKEQKLAEKQSDMADLLSQAMEKSNPLKINNLAQNLLISLIHSESPLLQLLHFTIPFRFLDENTYGEFFVDKDCSERKGDAKEAKNILFIIQSDKYGNFEVDILARDNMIDLDIQCPDALVNPLKETRDKWNHIIEEQGYRLLGYHVSPYREGGQTILQRFPNLAEGKASIDVKV